MIWTRLYDPARTPAHWTSLVSKDQFVVFVVDANTAVPRDASGNPFSAQDGSNGESAALCDDLAEARSFAREVLARRPELCCRVYDSQGKSNPPIEEIYDPSVRDRYVGPKHARKLALGGLGVAIVGTVFVVIDTRRNLEWIWGYIIGLKCLVVACVLLTRAFLEWREFRGERE